MSKRLYPHNHVRYWYVYDIDDICALFANKGLHPQTVRAWIKSGLKTIDTGKPLLIYGHDLITHLKRNNTASKCVTAFDEFFCMGCQDARPAYQNKAAIIAEKSFMNVKARCRTCKKTMCKSHKLMDLHKLKQILTLVDVSQLYDCEDITDKTHIHACNQNPLSESSQGELFPL